MNAHENSTDYLLGELTKSSREESFQKFINETKIKIPESMIEDHTLVINDKNPECLEFLDIFKETNIQVNAPKIHSAKILLLSYRDYANILHLLEHLNVEKIESFKGGRINYDNEVNTDFCKMVKMVTGEKVSNFYVYGSPNHSVDGFIFYCYFGRFKLIFNSNFIPIILIPQDLMEIIETFEIEFDLYELFPIIKEEIGRITRYAIQHKKYITLQFCTQKASENIMPSILMELGIDHSNKYILINFLLIMLDFEYFI